MDDAQEERERIVTDEWDWGCDHCRNDGRLNEMGCCPVCDAQFDDEDEHPLTHQENPHAD
jgi:hypothetical protein|tara:strand:- start:45685 stop:45864 length:180 start_codon:yes stop_codon:yes gene_type:complete